MTEKVLFEQEGGIATITLNWPETRNAITDDVILDPLEEALHRVNRSDDIRVMILTGTDPAFSSGGNLKDVYERVGGFAGNANDLRQGYRRGIQRIAKLLYDIEVPAIAAVNGPAMGAGCDFTTMCDIRIASERAKFCETFCSLGLIPGDGGAWLLPRAIGMQRAAEMTFTADPIDAATALEWGLVSRVVPHEELMPTVRTLAERIARRPGPGLRMAKKLLREGQHTRLDTLLEMSAAMQAVAHDTPEHRAALEAVYERMFGAKS